MFVYVIIMICQIKFLFFLCGGNVILYLNIRIILSIFTYMCVFYRCVVCWKVWSKNTNERKTGVEGLINWDQTRSLIT